MFMNENKRKCAFHECTGFMPMSNSVLDIFFLNSLENIQTVTED